MDEEAEELKNLFEWCYCFYRKWDKEGNPLGSSYISQGLSTYVVKSFHIDIREITNSSTLIPILVLTLENVTLDSHFKTTIKISKDELEELFQKQTLF